MGRKMAVLAQVICSIAAADHLDVNWAGQNLAAVPDVYPLLMHCCCVRLEVTWLLLLLGVHSLLTPLHCLALCESCDPFSA